MTIARDAIPQIIVNLVLIGLGAGFARRAFQRKKNRSVVVALVVLGIFGLSINLTGHTIDGFLQGGQIHDVR